MMNDKVSGTARYKSKIQSRLLALSYHMMDRATIINTLELLLNECFETIDNLRTNQQIKENDARVTFFKHLVDVIDSTILLLFVA